MEATITKQTGFINLHSTIETAKEVCEHPELRAHFEHILFGLTKIIESHGPTPEYYKWFNSTSST